MGFTEILTIIFILLKAFGKIDWSWWLVFLPEIVAGVIYILLIVSQIVAHRKITKDFHKHTKDLW